MKAQSQFSSILTKRSSPNRRQANAKRRLRCNKKNAPSFLSAHFLKETVSPESGFGFPCAGCFLALRFQLGELLGRKNSFRPAQESFAALLRTTDLHTFGLPRFNFCLLVRCEIQARQINAGD